MCTLCLRKQQAKEQLKYVGHVLVIYFMRYRTLPPCGLVCCTVILTALLLYTPGRHCYQLHICMRYPAPRDN
jgi:hypothetical protein